MVVITAAGCFPILANNRAFRLRRIDPAGDQKASITATSTCACVADLLRRFQIDDELDLIGRSKEILAGLMPSRNCLLR